jgi:hypothetical protein
MATAADLGGHMYNWLQRVGFPVREYTTQYGIPQGGDARAADAWASPGQVYINPKMAKRVDSAAARFGKRGRLNQAQLQAIQVLMHEGVHQMRYGRNPEGYTGGQALGSPGGYEEAATEAVTQDLLPIFAAKMYGHKMPGARHVDRSGGTYADLVQNLRQLSTFGSGSKTFTDRNARVWRRNFLHADATQRQELVNQAMQARIAWGQTSGRDKPQGKR